MQHADALVPLGAELADESLGGRYLDLVREKVQRVVSVLHYVGREGAVWVDSAQPMTVLPVSAAFLFFLGHDLYSG